MLYKELVEAIYCEMRMQTTMDDILDNTSLNMIGVDVVI